MPRVRFSGQNHQLGAFARRKWPRSVPISNDECKKSPLFNILLCVYLSYQHASIANREQRSHGQKLQIYQAVAPKICACWVASLARTTSTVLHGAPYRPTIWIATRLVKDYQVGSKASPVPNAIHRIRVTMQALFIVPRNSVCRMI